MQLQWSVAKSYWVQKTETLMCSLYKKCFLSREWLITITLLSVITGTQISELRMWLQLVLVDIVIFTSQQLLIIPKMHFGNPVYKMKQWWWRNKKNLYLHFATKPIHKHSKISVLVVFICQKQIESVGIKSTAGKNSICRICNMVTFLQCWLFSHKIFP